MKTSSLYESAAVRESLGPTLRPGGDEVTLRLLELADIRPGSLVLDAGCGCGGTLDILQENGLRTVGLDLQHAFLTEARALASALARSDLAAIPLQSGSVDVIVCECVWNLTDKERVLDEFFRVLRPGGQLLLSDIYARGQRVGQWPVRCCFAQATDLETVVEQVEGAGFTVDVVEDHSRKLAQTAAQFVFQHGSLQQFWQAVTGDADMAASACAVSRQSKPGLFALVAHS